MCLRLLCEAHGSLQDEMYPNFFLDVPTVSQLFWHVSPKSPKHMHNMSTVHPVSQCTIHCFVPQHEAKVSCQHVSLCSDEFVIVPTMCKPGCY